MIGCSSFVYSTGQTAATTWVVWLIPVYLLKIQTRTVVGKCQSAVVVVSSYPLKDVLPHGFWRSWSQMRRERSKKFFHRDRICVRIAPQSGDRGGPQHALEIGKRGPFGCRDEVLAPDIVWPLARTSLPETPRALRGLGDLTARGLQDVLGGGGRDR